MIETSDLTVSVGRVPVLHGIGLTANAGELTAIIGPNGSGKTTLLKALSGDLPYQGSVCLNGREMASMRPPEQAAMRAVLPQSTTLSFPFTVREIVNLGVRSGLNRATDRSDLVEQALRRVDLAGFAGRFYQQLSGGEQQRVQLARVLCQVWQPVEAGTPRWLFLDEPVSGLDIRHQLTVLDVARDFAAAGGGVIAILHDLNLAAMYAHQVIAIRKGRIHSRGAPSEVINEALLREVFDCRLGVGVAPPPGHPFVLPQAAVR